MSLHQTDDKESLLDVTLKKYTKESMRKMFNLRLFFVTKVLAEFDKDSIRNYLNKWLGQEEVDPIYGMSFLYPGCTIHLLQSNSEKMFQFIRSLVSDKKIHGMWPIRILLSTDNVPVETIKFYDITQIDSLKLDSFSANVPLEVSIAEVYNSFLSLAETLSSMADLKRSDAMSNLLREYNSNLPADFRVLGFAENVEVTLIEEYLDIFDSPIAWTPMFDTVWPPQWRHDLPTMEKISEMDIHDQKSGN